MRTSSGWRTTDFRRRQRQTHADRGLKSSQDRQSEFLTALPYDFRSRRSSHDPFRATPESTNRAKKRTKRDFGDGKGEVRAAMISLLSPGCTRVSLSVVFVNNTGGLSAGERCQIESDGL